MPNCAVTIVSKNYLALAMVLAETYTKHHPNDEFFICLVDKNNNYIDTTNKSFTLLELEDMPIPNIDRFIYQYHIMELNTAVKPYILQYLLEKKFNKVLYIDPDIKVFSPLNDVWQALDDNSIVLTPHMRTPFFDNFTPDDVGILTSGTYNLGFLGLRNTKNTHSMLRWWQEKLYAHCTVDIPNGLFVDQKWMDLIPGLYEDVFILHNPAYNIAYWNLHDRELTYTPEGYFVDKFPLAFFHFSGYNPLKPYVLSKHQTRHDLRHMPVVKKICNEYGQDLINKGFPEITKWPYAYAKLSNGVQNSKHINWITNQCIRKGIDIPSPLYEADKFCNFIMTVNPKFNGKNLTPLQSSIIHHRPDVAAAFPNIHTDPNDPDFNSWVQHSGAKEEKLAELNALFPKILSPQPRLEYIFDKLDEHNRHDVYDNFPDMWYDNNAFQEFLQWIAKHGVKEFGWPKSIVEGLHDVLNVIPKVLNLYFIRRDLQNAFPNLHDKAMATTFSHWLKVNEVPFEISGSEIAFFKKFCHNNPLLLQQLCLLYSHKVRDEAGGTPTVYDLLDTQSKLSLSNYKEIALSLLDGSEPITLEEQAVIYLVNRKTQGRHPSHPMSTTEIDLDIELTTKFNIKHLMSVLDNTLSKTHKQKQSVNLCALTMAQTGMGQSSRSMLSCLHKSFFEMDIQSLPTITDDGLFGKFPWIYGIPKGNALASITVANADTTQRVLNSVPNQFWGERNIGYWVWETAMLPNKYQPATAPFDEIWTPSEASAQAIRAITDKKVRTIPHAIDMEELNNAKENRRGFKLPKKKVIFGYFFDQKSILERKNPTALVEAFQKAFSDRDDVLLLIKVNDPKPGSFDYEVFKSKVKSPNILLLEKTLSRAKTISLMKSIDVYVSPHRFEGFGLTCAEAMGLAKTVIASRYSGNLDFMNDDNSILVDGNEYFTDRSFGPYPPRSKWFNIDCTALANAMIKATNTSLRKQLGVKAKAYISEKLNAESIAKLIEESLQEK